MPSPLVSVMMPARNAARYIDATIQSLLLQTYENWELIFVDDGSSDETFLIASRFAENDARIRVHKISHSGRGRARNECVRMARGKYIAVWDADDLSVPSRLERQVIYLESNGHVGIVGSWWSPFSTTLPTGDERVCSWPTSSAEIKRALSRRRMRIHNATVMLRREIYDKAGLYDERLRRAQDYEFFCRAMYCGVEFAAIPAALVYYRQDGKVPSLRYFRENGMYMAYADSIRRGADVNFEAFSASSFGYAYRNYLSIKYIYFYLKVFVSTNVR